MQKAYQSQLTNLSAGYQQNAAASNGVLSQLQQSLASQQQTSAATAKELQDAKAASDAQAALLADARSGAQAQYGDVRTANLNTATSLFGRLQNRVRERKTVY